MVVSILTIVRNKVSNRKANSAGKEKKMSYDFIMQEHFL